jgi:hypothetical protein
MPRWCENKKLSIQSGEIRMSPINSNPNDNKSIQPAARHGHGLRLLSLLLLVSLACSIPGLG